MWKWNSASCRNCSSGHQDRSAAAKSRVSARSTVANTERKDGQKTTPAPIAQRSNTFSVCHASRRRERKQPPSSQQVRREAKRAEDLNKSAAADIEPARISPGGRHHHARSPADNATPPQAAPPPKDVPHS